MRQAVLAARAIRDTIWWCTGSTTFGARGLNYGRNCGSARPADSRVTRHSCGYVRGGHREAQRMVGSVGARWQDALPASSSRPSCQAPPHPHLHHCTPHTHTTIPGVPGRLPLAPHAHPHAWHALCVLPAMLPVGLQHARGPTLRRTPVPKQCPPFPASHAAHADLPGLHPPAVCAVPVPGRYPLSLSPRYGAEA